MSSYHKVHMRVGLHLGTYNIFQRPDEAMLFVMVITCMHEKLFCYSEPLRSLFFSFYVVIMGLCTG